MLAALIATTGAVGYAALTWGDASDAQNGLSKSDREWVRKAQVMEVCCVWFGLIYWSGRGFARLLRARALADEIRRRSRWHMQVLHLAWVR